VRISFGFDDALPHFDHATTIAGSDARATSRPEATDKMELETKDGEMEEGETRGDTSVAATMSTQITSLFDGLLDFLAVSSQGSMGSSKLIIPCVEVVIVCCCAEPPCSLLPFSVDW